MQLLTWGQNTRFCAPASDTGPSWRRILNWSEIAFLSPESDWIESYLSTSICSQQLGEWVLGPAWATWVIVVTITTPALPPFPHYSHRFSYLLIKQIIFLGIQPTEGDLSPGLGLGNIKVNSVYRAKNHRNIVMSTVIMGVVMCFGIQKREFSFMGRVRTSSMGDGTLCMCTLTSMHPTWPRMPIPSFTYLVPLLCGPDPLQTPPQGLPSPTYLMILVTSAPHYTS